jgi:endonuclease/exonuclease/phosphatase family metal-dependent hydrolase
MSLFRVISYNIENGIYLGNILNNIRSFADQGVQAMCLQEVREIPGRPAVGKRIEKTLGPDWKCHFLQDTEDPVNGLGLGICWNRKRIELMSIKDTLLPKSNYNWVEKLVNPGGKPSQRGVITALFKSGQKEIRISSLHLDWQGGAESRFQQISGLKDRLGSFKGKEIICGDFNTGENRKRLGKSYTRFNQAIGMEFTEAFEDGVITLINGVTADPTYPYLYMLQKLLIFLHIKIGQRMDYIWYKGMQVKKSEIFNLSGSDHLPLLAEFEI